MVELNLTKRQQEIFDFVKRYAREHGYPPTVRDIGKAIGLTSSSTVHAHLANLERLGLLRRDPTKPRAIEVLVDKARQSVKPHGPAAGRPGRGGPADAGRGEHRGVRAGARDRGRRRGRVRPAREGRLDEGRRHPRRGLRDRPPPGDGHGRRDRRGAGGGARRPSSASSGRATTCACSRRTTRSSRSTRATWRSLGRVVGVCRRVA